MGSRGAVPVVEHYNLRSANSFSSSPRDLNTVVDGRGGEIAGLRGSGGNDDDDDSSAVDCIHEPYRDSLPIHGVGVEEDNSSLEHDAYDILTTDDILPIENARAKFMEIIVDHFITSHVIEVPDCEVDYTQSAHDKLSKRKTREIHYEGDARFMLPLMYVANMYETLVNQVNVRLSSVNGFRGKTIGVALEAAGGLYRKLAKKFPRKGTCTFKRRELATSLETRTKFPELVIQEEKRVRFVVVNGLSIVEKPTSMPVDDADWFKRLTGRGEVTVSAQDYKFYSPRHKYRRVSSSSLTSIPGFPTFTGADNSPGMATSQGYCSTSEPQSQLQAASKHHMHSVPNQPQYHSLQHNIQNSVHHAQHAAHFSPNHQCSSSQHLPDVAHPHQSLSISQHMASLPSLSDHVGGRLHILPTGPAKFCDECGAPYLRDTSKFCSECGVKRLGIYNDELRST